MIAHVEEHSFSNAPDLSQSRPKLRAAVAPKRAEDVAREAFRMDAHKYFLLRVDLTFHQRQMTIFVYIVGVSYDIKFPSKRARQLGRSRPVDERFSLHSVLDQARDCYDLKSMFTRRIPPDQASVTSSRPRS